MKCDKLARVPPHEEERLVPSSGAYRVAQMRSRETEAVGKLWLPPGPLKSQVMVAPPRLFNDDVQPCTSAGR